MVIRSASLLSLLALAACDSTGASMVAVAGSGGASPAGQPGVGQGQPGAGGSNGDAAASPASALRDSGAGSSMSASGASAQGGDGIVVITDAATDAEPVEAGSVACGEPVENQNPGNPCWDVPPPALTLTTILSPGTLFAPVMAAWPPGDTSRAFVITRGGTIRIIENGVLLETPFLDLTGLVSANAGTNEFGLLGIAFDPAFSENGKIWLHYNVDADPIDSVTASVEVSPNDPNQGDLATLTTLFAVHQPALNHNGGMLAFGPDHCLYLSLGDGGGGPDPYGNGQATTEPLGSLLRVDPRTGDAAPGNPGFAEARIWNYGLRNPWRFSFDRETGDLYLGDVGQYEWEEVDVEPAGVGGFNYGWSILEGTHGFAGSDLGVTRLPVKDLAHVEEGHAIIGGYVYRGNAIPELRGRYVYADHENSQYWVLTYAGESEGQPQLCDDYEITADLDAALKPTAFAEDPDGALHILTLSGGVYRIDPG